MKTLLVTAAAAFLTSFAGSAGAASYFPVAAWSEVVLDRGARTGLERKGLIAKSVDGRASVHHGTLHLQPGVHTLVLQWNPKGTFARGPGHVLRLDAKPCKRYYVVARFAFASSASTSTWQPQVQRTEDIIGCTPTAGVP